MNNWIKTIFRHQTQQGGAWYSVAVSGKDEAGEKKYEYWPVDFPQGTEIADRTRIEFKDFYISFYTRRDGTIQYKFVVQDFLMQPASYQQQGWNNGQQRPPQQYQQAQRTAAGATAQNRQAQQMDFEAIDESVPF